MSSSGSSIGGSPEGSRTSLDPVDGGPREEDFTDLLSSEKLKVLETNDQIKELQTVLRDCKTTRSDFVFYADRLIRLMVEEGLNGLQTYQKTIRTPTGCEYEGQWFEKMNCAVSILRSGEVMEKGLRDCCRSIRIGKILIRRDQETRKPRVYYAKFPPQIEKRQILLLHPVLESGATVLTALRVLKEHGVKEEKIQLVTLFATPRAVRNVLTEFSDITLLTSEVHPCCPSSFGQKYFGSD